MKNYGLCKQYTNFISFVPQSSPASIEASGRIECSSSDATLEPREPPSIPTPHSYSELQAIQSPTLTSRYSNDHVASSAFRGKKRNIGAHCTAPEEKTLSAALMRLSAPKRAEDQFSSFATMLAVELRSLNKENPLQVKIAKRLINEIMFLAATNTLSVHSKVVNVGIR